jgi:hypothetical protein
MNSYSVNSMILDTQKQPYNNLLYIIIPLFFGIIIDILFSQIMGTQYCSLNKTEYTCLIHGIRIEQWQREVVRFILQLSLILCALLLLHKFAGSTINHMYLSLFGNIGLILLFIVQVDLFSDFRRFCNGLVFSIKHN